MQKKILGLFVACAMFGLWACGDDSSTSSDSKESSETDLIVDTFDDLVVCSDKREGVVAYVKDEKTEYTCIDKKWTADDEEEDDDEDAKSSNSKKITSSSREEEESSSSSVILSSSEEFSSSETKSSAEEESSSSSVILSSSEESSSSETKSSAEEESSSSSIIQSSSEMSSSATETVISSSLSEKSSSSTQSSSSVKSSSSKANWAYLNPSISYGEMVDYRDKQVYKTVVIGTQTWMAENLNYIPDTTQTKYAGYKGHVWCYSNSADKCSKYGGLYNWSAAMDSAAVFSSTSKGCGYNTDTTCRVSGNVRGICPEGWHLPSKSEWSTLITFVTDGGSNVAGTILKSTSGWNNRNGENTYGFTALPAGNRTINTYFEDDGENAYFWSTSWYNSYEAYYVQFFSNWVNGQTYHGSKRVGYSVRCIKD